MGKLTDYAKNLILQEIVGKTNSLNLGNIYVALGLESSTIVDVTDGGITGFTEPSGNNYSRVLVGDYSQSSSIAFGNPTGGVIKNNKEINFDSVQTASWGELGYWALYNAATGGTCIAYGHLLASDLTTDTTVTPAVGEKVYFAKESIQISMP